MTLNIKKGVTDHRIPGIRQDASINYRRLSLDDWLLTIDKQFSKQRKITIFFKCVAFCTTNK